MVIFGENVCMYGEIKPTTSELLAPHSNQRPRTPTVSSFTFETVLQTLSPINSWWPLTCCRSPKGSSKCQRWRWGSFTPPFGPGETATPAGRKGYIRSFASWTAPSRTPSDCPAAPWADARAARTCTQEAERNYRIFAKHLKKIYTMICSLRNLECAKKIKENKKNTQASSNRCEWIDWIYMTFLESCESTYHGPWMDMAGIRSPNSLGSVDLWNHIAAHGSLIEHHGGRPHNLLTGKWFAFPGGMLSIGDRIHCWRLIERDAHIRLWLKKKTHASAN